MSDRGQPLSLTLRSVGLGLIDDRDIVTDINLQVPAGETLALIGQSGAGKTSLALAIMGLWPGRIDGSICLGSEELVGISESEYRRLRGSRMAFMMQDPVAAINPTLTIGWQVREVLRFRRGLTRSAAKKESLVWLEKAGLNPAKELSRAYLHQLSGGMAQRASLAIALACRPQLMIADEPFSALDPQTASEQIELLRRCQEDSGFSLLLITHDLVLAKNLAEHVTVIKDGRLIEAGAVKETFEAPRDEYTKSLLAASFGDDRVESTI